MSSFIALLLNILFTTTITLFIIIVPSTNGENEKYTSCSAPYSCGTIQNITYPFWGANRPNYCGTPNFKLSCDSNITSFNIFQNFSFELNVNNINTNSYIIEFDVKNLLGYCYLQDKNYTLLPNLKPIDSSKNVTLFYGCNNTKCESYKSKSYICSTYNYGTNGIAYYFGNHTVDISKASKSCSCTSSISVPVAKRWFDEIVTSRDNVSFLSALKKQLIEAQYNASFDDCSKCEKSGGRCGSIEDSSSDQFVCYCINGARSSVCTSKSEEKKFKLILGLGIAGAVLVIVAIIISIWHYKKPIFVTRSASLGYSAKELEKGGIYFGVPLFSYSELVQATNNFDQSNELGTGGYGIVYYGKLKDGREVAVKRLYEKSYKRVEQFMNEVKILTRLRHQNLVSLYGCTSLNSKEPLLVYEYVRNGTLADHLYGETSKTASLPWSVRLRIAMETATALSYLHASDIIHRDVKTNNILLDNNFCAKVADFGLSRRFPTDVTHVSTAPLGTPGYLDPEYYQCYHLTYKSDVYSFGVVLVQLISSLPAVDLNRDKHEINLSNYAVNKIQHGTFDQLLDPQLGFRFDYKVKRMATLVGELAFQCLQPDKEFRPKMNEVLDVLKRIESGEYEGLLQVDEKTKNVEANHEHVKLLSNQRLFSSSPMSRWRRGGQGKRRAASRRGRRLRTEDTT